MKGSLLKSPNGMTTRRHSFRLRNINDIYGSDDALKLKETNEDISNVANRVKVETLLYEQGNSHRKSGDHFNDSTNIRCREKYGNKESKGGFDDHSNNNVTLKEIQKIFKAKEQKVLKSVVPTEDVFKTVDGDLKMKIKEYESDLEEPLISLKLKLSKSSFLGRKRRKSEHHSSNGIFAGTAEGKCGIEENFTDNLFLKTDDCPIFSAAELKIHHLASVSLELDNNVRTENVSSCSLDGHITDNDVVSYISDSIDKCEGNDNYTSERFLEVSDGESCNRGESSCPIEEVLHFSADSLMETSTNSSSSVPELKISLHKNSELIYISRSDVLRTASALHAGSDHIAADMDFTTKYDYCDNSCSELVQGVDRGETENGKLSSFTGQSRHSCENGVPSEHAECDKLTHHPEIGGAYIENKTDLSGYYETAAIMDDSDTENHNVSSEENKQKNRTNYFKKETHDMGIDDGTELAMVSEDLRNLVGELPAQHMALYNNKNDVIDHILLCNETHDMGEASNSSKEAEQTDAFVQEDVEGDASMNLNGNHALPLIGGDSTMGTNDTSTNRAAELPNPLVAMGLAEALHCHSHNPPESLNSVSGFHHTDNSLFKAAEKFSSSTAEQKLYSTAEYPSRFSTNIVHEVDTERQDPEKQKCEPGMKAEDTPRKILSNRKTFSPACQEKLREALNGNDLYDVMKLSGYRGAAEILGLERMIKKPKSHRNNSLSPVTKGILKSPEISSKTQCSCMKSSLTHTQTEEAIQFSLRQMHDFKSIAAKLLKGLNSMKYIIEESLCQETCSSIPSKFTAEEIRLAAEHASELESTANKLLSIMSRDCNRFCKIMRSAEDNATSPVSGVLKGQKRITFADEIGGSLCHVKVFDQELSSLVVPENGHDNA